MKKIKPDKTEQLIRDRFSAALIASKTKLSLYDWAIKNIYIDSAPFSLEGHEYLRELYTDFHTNITVQKAAQTGFSTWAIIATLYAADNGRVTIGYYFPTDDDVRDFSKDRIEKMIQDSPYLGNLARGFSDTNLKQIHLGSIYLRGMFTKAKVKSLSLDWLIIDELDECKPEHVQFAFDRLLHSKHQVIRILSQPSLPDVGVNEFFNKSDQRYFLLTCPHCGYRDNNVQLTFPECIHSIGKSSNKRYFLACKKCGKELDTQIGEWVPKYPSRKERRGYSVTGLISTIPPKEYSSMAEMAYLEWKKAKTNREKKRLMISVVGLPFAGDEMPLTEQNIKAALGNHAMRPSGECCVMGVDVGDTLHITISDFFGDLKKKVIHIESTEDWNRLDYLMMMYNIQVCVIDAMPYKKSALDFARRFAGYVYICYFKGDSLKTGAEGQDEAAVLKVTDDRTKRIDDLVEEVKTGEIVLPSRSDYEVVETVIKHLKKLIKIKKVSEDGSIKFIYVRNVENHFGFSLAYMSMAATLVIENRAIGLRSAGGSYYGTTH